MNIRYVALRLVVAAVLLWAIFAGIGRLLGKDATPLDQSVTDSITSNRTTTWDDITQWVSLCSATLTVVVITVGRVRGAADRSAAVAGSSPARPGGGR